MLMQRGLAEEVPLLLRQRADEREHQPVEVEERVHEQLLAAEAVHHQRAVADVDQRLDCVKALAEEILAQRLGLGLDRSVASVQLVRRGPDRRRRRQQLLMLGGSWRAGQARHMVGGVLQRLKANRTRLRSQAGTQPSAGAWRAP